MNHGQAWKRLPDLLEDRDNPELLAHVSDCPDCQRQLFLLGRADRLLRDAAWARRAAIGGRHKNQRRILLAATVAVVGAAALLTPFAARHAEARRMMLRTSSGQLVAEALMGHSDARNVSLDLTARGLPVRQGRMYVLWAGDNSPPPVLVGRFMVDRTGSCRVRFSLPATRPWAKVWVALPGKRTAVVAST